MSYAASGLHCWVNHRCAFGKTIEYKVAVARRLGFCTTVPPNPRRIKCWVMQHNFQIPARGNGTQRFWISKRTHEIRKEEDKTPDGYRYKLKVAVAGE